MRWCYVYLPRFPVQRRVMETPSLAQKPLVLVENVRGHLRVAFASTAAMRAGIRVGMTRTAACALVPELPCFDYEPQRERAALVSLGEALLQCGPRFQLCAPDGLFLDAAAAHLFGGEAGLCERVLEVCRAHGYRAKVAVASDAFTARALARFGEKRAVCVPASESQRALAPLPLSALEDSEAGLIAPLRSLGITTLGEVAALPPGAIIARLGAPGLKGHRLCRGGDDTPFVAEPLAEVLEERIDLDWPAEAMEPLLFGLKTLLDRLCARLCGRAQAAVRLDFTLRLDPSGEAKVPLTLARPSSQSRLLLDLARHRISDLTLPHPVVGLTIRVVEACEDRGQQLPLGDAPEGDAALEVVLSRLATTLGEDTLFSAELEEAHRPEGAYAAKAFRPPSRERGMLAEVDRAVTGAERAGAAGPARKGSGRKYVHGPLTDESAAPVGGPPGRPSDPGGAAAPRSRMAEGLQMEASAPDGHGDRAETLPTSGPMPVEPSASTRPVAGGATVVSLAAARAVSPPQGSMRPADASDGAPARTREAEAAPPVQDDDPTRAWRARAVSARREVSAYVTGLSPGVEETFRERPARLFGKPATLDAEVGAAGEIVSARILGRRRKVQALAGPERLSGDWWDVAYARDYYRVYFEGLGPVWIYRDERDGRFYLQGMFD